jgi:hypothetical protein
VEPREFRRARIAPPIRDLAHTAARSRAA